MHLIVVCIVTVYYTRSVDDAWSAGEWGGHGHLIGCIGNVVSCHDRSGRRQCHDPDAVFHDAPSALPAHFAQMDYVHISQNGRLGFRHAGASQERPQSAAGSPAGQFVQPAVVAAAATTVAAAAAAGRHKSPSVRLQQRLFDQLSTAKVSVFIRLSNLYWLSPCHVSHLNSSMSLEFFAAILLLPYYF